MARNAHPEVTEQRILDAARELFMEQGYEKTSIQDIVNRLGDLSKGAIYHHFKSKEAILATLTDRDGDTQMTIAEQIIQRTDMNALEKLRAIFRQSITDAAHTGLMREALPMLNDPQCFASNMRFWSSRLPQQWLTLVEAGVEDGSIPTEYPREAADLLALLPNYWLIPAFYPATHAELEHRVRCFALMLDTIGLPMFDEELITLSADMLLLLQPDDHEIAARDSER